MITNRQLVLLLFIILIGEAAAYVPGLMASTAGLGSWLPIIINSLIFALAAFIIVKLNSKYNGKMLFEYSGEIIGKAGAYILGMLFAVYFLIITAYILTELTNMIRNNFLYNTPPWFELLLGIPIFGYAAYKGIRNIARMAEITGMLLLIIVVLLHTAMFFQGRIENILPFFNPYEAVKYIAGMKQAIIPFLGIEVLTIIPFALTARKKAPRAAFLTVIASGLLFVFIIETSFMMVGVEDIVNYTDPLIVAMRRVEIPAIEFLTRIDVTYLTVNFAAFFVVIIIEYCAVVEYVCKMYPKFSRLAVVIAVGAILFVLGFFTSPIDNLRKVFGVYLIYAIPIASLGIPLLLTVISRMRSNASKTN